MIDITGVNLHKFVKEIYALSRPQGLGAFHFVEGPLSDEQANAIVAQYANNRNIAVSMDYVNGRACKMVVFRKKERLEIGDQWFDHSNADLWELRNRCLSPKSAS
jgi:hypothetical protein